MGVLPFFHSFGYTFPLWLIASGEPSAVYHFNPVEAKVIGKLCEEYGVTVIAATPTFIKRYLQALHEGTIPHRQSGHHRGRKAAAGSGARIRGKIRRLPDRGIWHDRAVAPGRRQHAQEPLAAPGTSDGERKGTIGRAIPHVAAKIVDPDTKADLGPIRTACCGSKVPT